MFYLAYIFYSIPDSGVVCIVLKITLILSFISRLHFREAIELSYLRGELIVLIISELTARKVLLTEL